MIPQFLLELVVGLGNPKEPRAAHLRHFEDGDDPELVFSGYNYPGHTSGYTIFGVDIDPLVFDPGHYVIVSYSRNAEYEVCEENEALNDECVRFASYTFERKILPHLHLDAPFIWVTCKTVDGCLTFTRDSLTRDMTYLPLPHLGELPSLPITSLRRSDWSLGISNVSLAIYEGQLYAFKHYCEPYDIMERFLDMLIDEVVQLCRLESPSIVRPCFIVSDMSGQYFRGYLMPFYPAGTLRNILEELHPHGAEVELPEVDGSNQVALKRYPPATAVLPWAVKELWASDIARATLALDEAEMHCGDLKLENVVLGTDGRLLLIDAAPVLVWTAIYAPPEIRHMGPGREGALASLTAARDVFAMGMMMWALAEEVVEFHRDNEHAPCLPWTEGNDAAPGWYRQLVERCVRADPDARPSPLEVCEEISANTGLP